jgi:hypothetical protein
MAEVKAQIGSTFQNPIASLQSRRQSSEHDMKALAQGKRSHVGIRSALSGVRMPATGLRNRLKLLKF